jgi:hypothetical protein
MVNCHTADTKPVKQEVNDTVMLSPLVFPDYSIGLRYGGNPIWTHPRHRQTDSLQSGKRLHSQHFIFSSTYKWAQ